ncbi:MAG TPA: glycosyltransferase family 4 protein [Microthrixaceae bacterium]|nr:glycosyltransferase family 4 protein [Microthrixaceae bacterium]
MRIAIIAPPWVPVPPPSYGGTEAVLDNLARGLQAAGHTVVLFATGDSDCAVPTRWTRPTAAGIGATGPAAELCHVIHAYREIVEWGADVVHDHTLVGPVYAQQLGLPVVTTNHGPFDGDLADLYREVGSTVPIIAISEDHASTAAAAGIPVAAVIHHGVDIETFPFGAGDGGYALFLGRMAPEKGVHIAARVARRAGVPLRIAAKMREPAEEAYFESSVAPLLGDGVEYLGEVSGPEKLSLLAGAICLLNPIAWSEPFGMVMIEALACGTPVVARPVGSVPELITDGITGFVARSEERLCDAMTRVAQLDRARCRREVATRFSSERMVAEHLDVYGSVARNAMLERALLTS